MEKEENKAGREDTERIQRGQRERTKRRQEDDKKAERMPINAISPP